MLCLHTCATLDGIPTHLLMMGLDRRDLNAIYQGFPLTGLGAGWGVDNGWITVFQASENPGPARASARDYSIGLSPRDLDMLEQGRVLKYNLRVWHRDGEYLFVVQRPDYQDIAALIETLLGGGIVDGLVIEEMPDDATNRVEAQDRTA